MRELTELKGKIREKKTSYRKCAKIASMSLNTFNGRMNGKTAFDIVEASKLAEYLEISADDIKKFLA